MMSVQIRKNSNDQFVEVILNRPQVRNAFDPAMIRLLTETFNNFSNENQCRAVILRGEGKVFCAGADLTWMESMVNYTYAENQVDAQKLFKMFEAIENCHLPVICCVHGAAMGGALGLMAASDIILAETSTQFCFSEVKLGIAPAVISAFVLKYRSLAQVSPWMISGQLFGVNEAKSMHLVHSEFSNTDTNLNLDKVLGAWKSSFLDAAPDAVKVTKKLLKQVVQSPWRVQEQITTEAIAARRVSSEGQEGLKSFLNKSVPSWRN